jgi:predicted lipid-binding transport protein (Tim44 family)
MLNLSKNFFSMSLVYATALVLFAEVADAKGMSRGKSMGRQSDNVSQRQDTPTQTNPNQQATSAQNTQQQSRTAANPAQNAAQPPRNRWLGPLAGIAAGLGLAALFSHLGMGAALAEAMGSMLLIAAVVMLGLFLWRRMRGASLQPGTAAAGAGAGLGHMARTEATESYRPTATSDATFNPQTDSNPNWTIPIGFDTDKFLRSAKMFFVRLQADWDTADLDDIRTFTTPEMFAEIKLELNERGASNSVTDIVSVEAQLLGIEHIPRDEIASVRFTGTLRQGPDAPVESFDEVWNLSKSPTNPQGWILAGIQQVD